jgi:hypothetical protein
MLSCVHGQFGALEILIANLSVLALRKTVIGVSWASIAKLPGQGIFSNGDCIFSYFFQFSEVRVRSPIFS